MFLVLEKLYITKLKIVLQSNYFYILLFVIGICHVIFNINFIDRNSIYDIDQNEFLLEVYDYEIKEDYISLTLCDKECLVGNYYFKNVNEIKNVKYGIKVKINGELSVPSNNTIPKAFNYRKYLKNKAIYYTVKISSIEVIDSDVSFINGVRNWLCDWIDKFDSTGYVKGFVLGIKDNINEEEYSKFQLIGVTHLFAISGMHISVILVVLNRLLSILNNKLRYFIIDVLLLLYGAVLYFPASLKRTICFYVFNTFNKVFNINISSLKLLFLVIFSLVIYDYKIIYDIGFLYSVCTVGGILYSSNFIKSESKILSSFKLSLVAFLFSLPITLYNFYSINLLSIFYNMFYVLFVSTIIYPLSLIVLFVPKLYFLFEIFIYVLVCVSNMLTNIKISIIYMDFNIFEVLLFYLFLLLFINYKTKILFVFMLLIIFIDLVLPCFDSSSYVYFFDVGQGDSSMIITPYRKEVILVDTGGVRNRNVSDDVTSFMKSKGINSVDYMILSHGDFDHMGEVYNITKVMNIKNVIFNHNSFNELELDFIRYLDDSKINYFKGNNKLNITDNMRFLNDKVFDNENDNSIIFYLKLYNYSFLFTGDIGVDVEKCLIDKYNLIMIDVLKVGHHGSKTSSSKEFIDEISPKYSIISVGMNNRYGHPSDVVLDNLSSSKIYRTDKDGSIMFKVEKNRMNIETCPP